MAFDSEPGKGFLGFQPKKIPDTLPTEETEDDGLIDPCAFASRAKDKWVKALTIRHPTKPWESFYYQHIDARSVYDPTRFELTFSDQHERWRVTVTGRNLLKIYTLTTQARLEWLRAADRDFAKDGEAIILAVRVEEVKPERRG